LGNFSYNVLFNHGFHDWLWSRITLSDYSSMIRRLIWGESWQMMKDHWFGALVWLALSSSDFALSFRLSLSFSLSAHNLLNFWSEWAFWVF